MDIFAFLSILAAVGFVMWLIYRGGSMPMPESNKSVSDNPSSQMDWQSSIGLKAEDGTEPGQFSNTGSSLSLAARRSRLGAAFIDMLAGTLAVLPGAIISVSAGYSDAQLALGGFLLIAGVLGVAGYQIYLLVQRGQSVGKKIVGVRIVDHDSGQIPHWVRLVFVRQGVPGLVSAIPYVGWLFLLLDILFIARDDRRCIHDHLAGTVVCTGHPPKEGASSAAREPVEEEKALASPPPDRTTAVRQSASSDGSESPDASEVGDHSSNEAAAYAGSPPDRKEAEPLSVREKETLQSFAYRLQRLRALRADGTLSETEHRRARREALADAEKIVAASQLSREILIDIVKEMKERGQVTTGDVARVREDPY